MLTCTLHSSVHSVSFPPPPCKWLKETLCCVMHGPTTVYSWLQETINKWPQLCWVVIPGFARLDKSLIIVNSAQSRHQMFCHACQLHSAHTVRKSFNILSKISIIRFLIYSVSLKKLLNVTFEWFSLLKIVLQGLKESQEVGISYFRIFMIRETLTETNVHILLRVWYLYTGIVFIERNAYFSSMKNLGELEFFKSIYTLRIIDFELRIFYFCTMSTVSSSVLSKMLIALLLYLDCQKYFFKVYFYTRKMTFHC